MFRYEQRGRKGLAGFVILIVFILFTVLLLFFARYTRDVGQDIIKRTILVNMDVDDRGTEFLSLMTLVRGDEKYMKILGEMIASDAPSGLGDDIKASLDGIYDYYVFKLQYSGMSDRIFSKGSSSEGDTYQMEIPAPGARFEKVKAYVSLKR